MTRPKDAEPALREVLTDANAGTSPARKDQPSGCRGTKSLTKPAASRRT
jgi:hypothetical protein